jgi:hypothetical protein
LENSFAFPVSDWTPQVGEIIENFGNYARILAFDPQRGILVKAIPGQGFGRRDRWYANPEKIRPVR